jgi:hypothetical protein
MRVLHDASAARMLRQSQPFEQSSRPEQPAVFDASPAIPFISKTNRPRYFPRTGVKPVVGLNLTGRADSADAGSKPPMNWVGI